MTAQVANIQTDQIKALLADRGYDVTETAAGVLRIREVRSGVSVQAVLEGDILFLSLTCTTVAESSITAAIMRTMLSARNGISTSYFQLYDTGGGQIAVTLNNFCKLEDLGHEDQDDILACVHFLLVDVLAARQLLSDLLV